MKANPVLLQKKYARIVGLFARKNGLSLARALDIFYHSLLYELVSEGVSDMHCMSDAYLVEELENELKERPEDRPEDRFADGQDKDREGLSCPGRG